MTTFGYVNPERPVVHTNQHRFFTAERWQDDINWVEPCWAIKPYDEDLPEQDAAMMVWDGTGYVFSHISKVVK